MTDSPKGKNPLAYLVLTLFCVSIVGSILAGGLYFAIDLPKQQGIITPENSLDNQCQLVCYNTYSGCFDTCDSIRNGIAKSNCESACADKLYECETACTG
ncbi:MAG: hypothetical protein ABFC24_09080 [Methanoregulaceae archaeon]